LNLEQIVCATAAIRMKLDATFIREMLLGLHLFSAFLTNQHVTGKRGDQLVEHRLLNSAPELASELKLVPVARHTQGYGHGLEAFDQAVELGPFTIFVQRAIVAVGLVQGQLVSAV